MIGTCLFLFVRNHSRQNACRVFLINQEASIPPHSEYLNPCDNHIIPVLWFGPGLYTFALSLTVIANDWAPVVQPSRRDHSQRTAADSDTLSANSQWKHPLLSVVYDARWHSYPGV